HMTTSQLRRMRIVAVALIVASVLTAWAALPAAAQVVRGNLVVTGSASPNPAAAGGQVVFAVNVKNDGTFSATGVLVTIQLPDGPTFVKCATSVKGQLCSTPDAAGVLTTTFATIKAHATVKVSVTVKTPAKTSASYVLAAKAHADHAIGGEEPRDGNVKITGTALSDTVPATFQPGGRTGAIGC